MEKILKLSLMGLMLYSSPLWADQPMAYLTVCRRAQTLEQAQLRVLIDLESTPKFCRRDNFDFCIGKPFVILDGVRFPHYQRRLNDWVAESSWES